MVDPKPSPYDTLVWGLLSGVLRGFIGTPLDAWAILSVSRNDPLGRASFVELCASGGKPFFRGFVPNTIRTSVRSPVHYASLEVGSIAYSNTIPRDVRESFPVLRGVFVGAAAALAESVVNTPLRVAQTLSVNGESLRAALRAEGARLFTRGFDGTLAHRLLSGAVFYGAYEQTLSLGVPMTAAAMAAGTAQVMLSAPLFAVTVHKQRRSAHGAGSLYSVAALIAKEQGVIPGLILPGLAPRLLHSWVVSPLVMWVIDSKLRAIRRD